MPGLYLHNICMLAAARAVMRHIPAPSWDLVGSHTKWKQAEGFADNLSKFMATIQGQAYQVGYSFYLGTDCAAVTAFWGMASEA